MSSGSAGPEQDSDEHVDSEQPNDLYSSAGIETPRAADDASAGIIGRAGEEAPAEQHGNSSVTTPTKQNFSAPPSTVASPVVQHYSRTAPMGEDSYFAPRPMHYHSASLVIPEDRAISISPSRSLHSRSPTWMKSSKSTAALTPEHALASGERPAVQRDYSSISSISNASTIRQSDLNHFLPLSQSRSRELSQYPNQAHSALQSQHHPFPQSPHFLRSRSSNSANFLTLHSAQSDADSPGLDDVRATTQTVSRDPSSAASSLGLFTPRGSSQQPQIPHGNDRTYQAPYLHYTHRQMPKETHSAEIDFDPISGRKVINQYEVIDELGRGVHGKVKLGRNLNDGKYVAIKIVERYSKRRRLGKNNNHESKIKHEIAILKKARHPNIVGLLEVIDDPLSKKVYIVLEHVEMGAVAWRTKAAPEIAFVEYRRSQREAAGDYNDEAARKEDERILEEARKHTDKHDKLKWRKLKQSRLDSGDGPTWSLEYGDDEDDEYSNPNISRTASATTSLSQTGKHSYQDNFPPRPDQTVIHHEDTFLASQHRTGSDNKLSDHGRTEIAEWSGLEGTMYGAYDDLVRGRTPSVAGSLSSAGYERDLEEQVPENFRWVPLMTMDEARRAFRDTLLGLEFLHYQGVVHRDIKPDNLLQAATGHIKISDFGVSYMGKEKTEPFPNGDEASENEGQDHEEAVELAKTVGTPAFYAPELCMTDPEAEPLPVTNQIDIWALGVTLYCLIYGRTPFYADNTFYVMRMIAEVDVFIPHQRLMAVEKHASSRPSSHGRSWASQASNHRRLPNDLVYEDVDDELSDLLRRMLTKDPRRRISLKEIKHHGWVVRDIQDKVRWLEETDPNYFTEGRRIEVSKEDMDVAVVPIQGLVERAKSAVRKGLEIMGIGGTKKSSSLSRRRAESTATNTSDRSNPASAASSSSTISQDARRQELRRSSIKPTDEALAAMRNTEHPLSQSVTASPEPREQTEFFPGPDSAPDSPMSTISQAGKTKPSAVRPAGPERVQTAVSTTGSIRTIRPGDLGLGTGATTLPAMPSTPLEMNTPPTFGGIFGGAKQKLMSHVKNARDRSIGRHGRASPIDRAANASADAHAQVSQAVSDVQAAGQVTSSAHLMEESATGSSVTSAVSSRAGSLSSGANLDAPLSEKGLSRNSSANSMTSPRRGRARTDASDLRPHSMVVPSLAHATTEWQQARPSSSSAHEHPQTNFEQAKAQQLRRRIQETQQRPESAMSHGKQPSTISDDCPPSPDDMTAWEKEDERLMHQEEYFGNVEPLPESAQSHLISSSSEDHFTGMSQSTSNPSIPSVSSADSSVRADEGVHPAGQSYGHRKESDGEELFMSIDQKAAYSKHTSHEDFAYDGDHAVESDDDDSDDSFVEMTRSKSRRQGLTSSESISIGELAHQRARRATNQTKSVRSGSNNTMKKVRPLEDSDPEGEQRVRPLSAAQ